mmetsp:Transcript_16443/g.33460  ORF Transcript_16443/g.33460 Transcript_16443/m.33460 type:complete len:251 (+) Transcript_16443:430-1182(+)
MAAPASAATYAEPNPDASRGTNDCLDPTDTQALKFTQDAAHSHAEWSAMGTRKRNSRLLMASTSPPSPEQSSLYPSVNALCTNRKDTAANNNNAAESQRNRLNTGRNAPHHRDWKRFPATQKGRASLTADRPPPPPKRLLCATATQIVRTSSKRKITAQIANAQPEGSKNCLQGITACLCPFSLLSNLPGMETAMTFTPNAATHTTCTRLPESPRRRGILRQQRGTLSVHKQRRLRGKEGTLWTGCKSGC